MTADGTYIEVPKIAKCLTNGGKSGGLHSDMSTVKVKQLSQLKESNGKTVPYQQNRFYDTNGIAPALLSQLTSGTHKIEVKPVLTPNRTEKKQNGRIFKEDGEPAFTLNCQDQHGISIENRIRRLTEIENERLQGFPDDWTRYGMFFKTSVQKYIYGTSKKWRTARATQNLITYAVNNTTLERKEISQTNRYKMCGNAVSTPPVQVIGERLEFTNNHL
jgi:DNA (cytosine-5)-methyltransferase 1